MKKEKLSKKLIIFISILVVNIFIFFLIDFSFYYVYLLKNERKYNFNEYIKRYKQDFKIILFDEVYRKKSETNYFRDFITNENTGKNPILIFGCSFGYGYLLNDEQSFSYKLSKYTGRSVYNRSISSLGIQYFPYIMEHYNLEKEIKNPEYIIYVMINNHVYRLYRQIMNTTEPYLDIMYKIDIIGGKTGLKEITLPKKFKYIYFFPIIRDFNVRLIGFLFGKSDKDRNFDFTKLHFLEAQKIVKKKFPNAKIIILLYEEDSNCPYLETPRWQELKKEGFIVINSYELTNVHLYEDKYKILNDPHPNEKAWDIIVPALTKRLNL